MLQRIQTIWLMVSMFLMVLFLYYPILHWTNNNSVLEYLKTIQNIFLLILTSINLLLSLVSIYMFKNRNLQSKLVLFNIVLLVILAGWILFNIYTINQHSTSLKIGIGAFLPSIAILFQILAFKGIISDERKVKSMNRMR